MAGTVTERRSYDAWGKRRNLNGTKINNAFITPDERHGFTGHEEWDEVGLIHMNGRLYDPATGRFLSADPTIQYADDMQNYNRYSYINNNPLSAVDYSGHGLFKKVFKAAKSVGKVVSSVLKNPMVRTVTAIVVAVYAPELTGALFGQAAAANSIITGAAFGLVGHGLGLEEGGLGQLIGHAAVGCGSSAMSGGSCASGALAAGFTKGFAGR